MLEIRKPPSRAHQLQGFNPILDQDQNILSDNTPVYYTRLGMNERYKTPILLHFNAKNPVKSSFIQHGMYILWVDYLNLHKRQQERSEKMARMRTLVRSVRNHSDAEVFDLAVGNGTAV